MYDIGEWNGQLFIAMPFYDGETLRQRIEHGPLAIDEAARIAGEIAAGWPRARRGLVHRDLKTRKRHPEHDGQVRIVDFGSPSRFGNQETVARMTATGTTVGTAPTWRKQATGLDVSARADIWAFA